MVHNKKSVIAAMGLFAALAGGNVSAALTEVTLTGTNVSYTFYEEELGLLGTASTSGDDLIFAPINFTASSSGLPFASQAIHVTVSANTGYQLSAFSLTESGGYSRTGNDVDVGVTGTFGATDIEGTTGNYIPMTIAADAPFDGATSSWSSLTAINLPATGWGGVDGMVGSVSLLISNQLFATVLAGSTASIYKDFVGVTVVTAPVPEAQTYALMLAGLGLVGFMARRRGSASA
ncbi:MAG: PEP-CTERM sorting domain-containing protein [Gammaproteobacteria bacterium]|nr:PEP-CTERM sorting domain-containing protein [Gammaproteobacteria bacterium]